MVGAAEGRAAAWARRTLGAALLVFGAEYFFHFMPEQPISDPGAAFLGALLDTGYMFPTIKIVEAVSGMLLVAGVAVPLATALFAPVALNIALYHVILDTNGMLVAALLCTLEAYLLWRHRAAFRPLLAACPADGGSAVRTDVEMVSREWRRAG